MIVLVCRGRVLSKWWVSSRTTIVDSLRLMMTYISKWFGDSDYIGTSFFHTPSYCNLVNNFHYRFHCRWSLTSRWPYYSKQWLESGREFSYGRVRPRQKGGECGSIASFRYSRYGGLGEDACRRCGGKFCISFHLCCLNDTVRSCIRPLAIATACALRSQRSFMCVRLSLYILY